MSPAIEPRRPAVAEVVTLADVTPSALEQPPAVVDGEVLHGIEIAPYPHASTGLGGCPSFTRRYVTDPGEVAAIARGVRWGR